MTFTPVINAIAAAEGVTGFDVADEEGEFLGTVIIHRVYTPPRVVFSAALALNATHLVAIAKFMREKEST